MIMERDFFHITRKLNYDFSGTVLFLRLETQRFSGSLLFRTVLVPYGIINICTIKKIIENCEVSTFSKNYCYNEDQTLIYV